MLILRDQSNSKVELNTVLGKVMAISFQGMMFLHTHTYQTLNEAIAACRQDLEADLFSIVIIDSHNHQFSLWCPLPEECINHG